MEVCVIIDKIFYGNDRKNNIDNILKLTNKKYYHPSGYCIMSNNEIICFTGSDIVNADNVCTFLRKKYPEIEFNISNQFFTFED
jgi:hypothetical protein